MYFRILISLVPRIIGHITAYNIDSGECCYLLSFLDVKNAFHAVDHDIFTECVFGVTAEGIENNWFERCTLR
jgi:hypothetical protein